MTIQQAKELRHQFRIGALTKEQASEQLKPFIILFNNKSVELAKKYGVKPKLFNITSFMR